MVNVSQFRVAVLLATYNGEKYLELQLDSLALQVGVDIDVLVNDDGSVDSTMEILKRFENKGLIKDIFQSQNIGTSEAFKNLLRQCQGYDYIALCDQDDIWDRDKLERSICALGNELPEMAISSRRYIDSQNSVIGSSPQLMRKLSLNNALIENVAYGNTIVLNSEAAKLVVAKIPSGIYIDHWIYLVMSSLGHIVHIASPLVSYRLHDSNLVGKSRLSSINNFRINSTKMRTSAQALLSGYQGQLAPAETDILQIYLRIWNECSPLRKLITISKSGLYRQKRGETFLYKMALFYSAILSSKTNSKF
jgi:glycosyltransferase involved in cell wall biosynthesis